MTNGTRLGFTGTRRGMTSDQRSAVLKYVEAHHNFVMWAIHGGCVGADVDFHVICKLHGIAVEIYPSNISKAQAHLKADVVHEPMNPLRRNAIIARECTHLIATPKTEEEEIRSGTWATVRYARKTSVGVMLVYPDGRIVGEWGGLKLT